MQDEERLEETKDNNISKGKKLQIGKKIRDIAIKVAVIIVLLLVVAVISYFGGISAQKKWQAAMEAEEKMQIVDEFFISGKLEDMSELTTQKLSYSGVIEVTEGKIPFITQKGFLMTYTAKVRAGIDLSQALVKSTADSITVTLPAAEVQSIDIDPDTIEFHAEKKALFNWKENEDVTEALSLAEQDVQEKAEISELLSQANDNAVNLVTEFLEEIVAEQEIIVNVDVDEMTTE